LAVNAEGGITQAELRAIVPAFVMTPPVKPEPAVIEVTVPVAAEVIV
jgi:hypothetical protein